MKESLTKKTMGGFLWLFSGSGVQSVLQIGVLAILARLITPQEFGLAQAALIVIALAKLMSQMGVGPAIVQREKLTIRHIRTAFTISFLLGIFLGLLVYISSSTIASFFNMPDLEAILKVVSLFFIIESFVVVSQSMLQRKIRMKAYSIANVISYLIGYGMVAVLLGYLGYGVWALIIGILSQVLIKAIITSYLEPHSCIPFIGKIEFKELMYFGGGFTIGKFANYIAGQGDNIITGKYLGADSLGLYSRAYAIMVKPVNLIGGALDKAIFPAMASVQNDKIKLSKAYLKGVSVLSAVALPLSIFIYNSAPEIVSIILGPDWSNTIIPLQILALGLVFRMGYKISDSLARATGAIYRRAWRQIAFAIVVIGLSFIGTYWGIEGVATGIVLAIMFNYFLMAHLSLSIIEVTWKVFCISHKQGVLNLIIFGGMHYISVLYFREQEINAIFTILISLFVPLSIIGIAIYFYPNIYRKNKTINTLRRLLN